MMKKNRRKTLLRSGTFIVLGTALLLGAAGLACYNRWLDYRAGQESDAAAAALVEELQGGTIELRNIPAEEETIPVSEEASQASGLDGASYMGILTIPKLERNLPVQSGWSLPQLKRSPCRYSGGVAEGELVIAAHNYKTHFGGLSTLAQGDRVIFTDLEGRQTDYEVKEICTVAATDIDAMVSSGYDLSLFTCNYGGKARITVRCMESR